MCIPRSLELFCAAVIFSLASISNACCPSDKQECNRGIAFWLRQPPEEGSKASIVVRGLSEVELRELARSKFKQDQWAALFSIHVDNPQKNDKTQRPPVLGSYRIEKDEIIFEPRFPLVPGIHYRQVFDPARLPKTDRVKTIVAEFTLPKVNSTPSTKVERVFPTTDLLPENQLKFYIHFSAPMSKGEAYQHVHLIGSNGKEVDLPFLRLDEELWNQKQTRFTLLFDPGRIKRGLKPREEVGPALEEGKSYTFVIDKDWIDAEGNPLKESFRKSFRAGPPDDKPIDPKTWKIHPPAAGNRDPLLVIFPKPLDHAMLERVIEVTDSAGHVLEGTIAVTDKETRWSFTPKQIWQPGNYHLTTDTALEDLAGNSIGRPFEVDVFHPIQRQVKSETIRIPFEIVSKK
jgi:hypothetical protein